MKNYHIFTHKGDLISIDDYNFSGKESLLKLVRNECYSDKTFNVRKRQEIEHTLNELGFEWDSLACPGHVRKKTTAVMMYDMMRHKYWDINEQFCIQNHIPLYNISAGELFDLNHPYFKKQIENIKQGQMYGTDIYEVTSSDGPQLLRYIACAPKLMIAKELDLQQTDLPVAFFEISKSYRHEESNELCLCSRIRAFHMVDTHILFKTFNDGLDVLLSAHKYTLALMQELYPSCELLCNVADSTFQQYKSFFKELAQTLGKDFLLQIIPANVSHGNDVNIDLEYKITDYSGQPLELATLQLDDGTSDFAYDVCATNASGEKKKVSTMHTVFLGSLDRAVYACVDSSLQKKKENGFLPLPNWINPINIRFMTSFSADTNFETEILNFERIVGAVDIDDRDISVEQKFERSDVKYIPFFVIVKKHNDKYLYIMTDYKRVVLMQTNKLSDIERYCRCNLTLNNTKRRYYPLKISQRLF